MMDQVADNLLARFPAVPRWPLTVDDYHRMAACGILDEDSRVELIEGELIAMSPIGTEHAHMVNTLNHVLVLAVGDRAIVSVQNPVRLNRHNEPQPDFALLRPRPGGYRHAPPGPQDVLLLIEIADSSLAYDRGAKLALYARDGIPELWVVDLRDQCIEVCRAPEGDGYTVRARVEADAMLEVQGLPDARIPAAACFA